MPDDEEEFNEELTDLDDGADMDLGDEGDGEMDDYDGEKMPPGFHTVEEDEEPETDF